MNIHKKDRDSQTLANLKHNQSKVPSSRMAIFDWNKKDS